MLQRLPMLFTSVAVGIIFAGAALVLIGSEAKARPMALVDSVDANAVQPPNRAVTDMVMALAKEPKKTDQVTRKYIDKIRKLQREGKLLGGTDFVSCAAIVARGTTVDDALFAHDLSLCALASGDTRAKQIAATTMDQVLVRMGSKQRFGTYVKNNKVLPVAEDVPDSMRLILGLPSMIVAKKLAKSGKPFRPTDVNMGVGVLTAKPTPVSVAVAY